jgi:hypothetical protein
MSGRRTDGPDPALQQPRSPAEGASGAARRGQRDAEAEMRNIGRIATTRTAAVRPHAHRGQAVDLLARALELAGRPGPRNTSVRELAEGCLGDDAVLAGARSRCLELLSAAPGDDHARQALKLLSMALHPSAAAWRAARRADPGPRLEPALRLCGRVRPDRPV